MIRLHWSPDSANIVVRIALEELGLAFEAVRKAFGAEQTAGWSFTQPSPPGEVTA